MTALVYLWRWIMKDATHHLRHVQKKVMQTVKKEESLQEAIEQKAREEALKHERELLAPQPQETMKRASWSGQEKSAQEKRDKPHRKFYPDRRGPNPALVVH